MEQLNRQIDGFSQDTNFYEEINHELINIIGKYDRIILKDGSLPTKTKKLIVLNVIYRTSENIVMNSN